jgi:hypothetical protein
MNGQPRLLAGLLALFATVGSAQAQCVTPSYQRPSISQSYGNPYFSRSRGFSRTRGYRRAPRRVWVPGRYQSVERRVWVEGGYRQGWVSPVYDTRVNSCGQVQTVLVQAGHWGTVAQSGRYESRWVDVWVDGYWSTHR